MHKDAYRARMEWLRERPRLLRFLFILNRLLTGAVFAAYPILLILLFRGPLQDLRRLAGAVLVPGAGFCLLSAIRARLDRPRPYEVYGVPSAVYKKTRGRSFPSRHVFSAFVIGMAWLAFCPHPLPGILILAAGSALALLRVLTGVHFAADVAAGALCGIGAGLFCLFFL